MIPASWRRPSHSRRNRDRVFSDPVEALEIRCLPATNRLRNDQPSYDYDETGRLDYEGNTTGIDPLFYTYDANGNRIGVDTTSPGLTPGTISLGNRLTQDATYNYAYDREGNLIQRTLRTAPGASSIYKDVYTWDNHNQLTKVESLNVNNVVLQRVNYVYDALGNRVGREETLFNTSGTQTSHIAEGSIRSGDNVVLDFEMGSGSSGNGKINRLYLSGPTGHELLAVDDARMSNEQTVWTYADTVGTIRSLATFDGAGTATVQHRLFDAFGNRTLTFGVTNAPTLPILDFSVDVWDGNRRDAKTGLYETQSGWYDSQSGRMLSDAGGPNGYALQPVKPASPPAVGTSLFGDILDSPVNWKRLAGRNADGVTPGGAFVTGFSEAITFGNADLLLGAGASAAHSGSGYYFAGLGVGIAGQIALGNWAAGVKAGSAYYALAKAYQAYEIAGDFVAVYQSSMAIANNKFTPLDALGFAPTIGWAARAYRGLRGVSRASIGLIDNTVSSVARSQFEVSSRGINRGVEKMVWGMQGRGVELVAFRDLNSGAKRLVRQLSEAERVFIGSGVHEDDLRQASMYLGKELGIVKDRNARLVAIKGTLDNLASRPGDTFLIHTHPVFDTRPSDFVRYDIPNATEAVEAVVDWGGAITYFNRNGILRDTPRYSGPINKLGYITGG